ncbi:MAG TPA: GNAT family N-acetyltransferase [Alphaproteobacteria bacterium]|nr:GNAT family N-acetyltransferase [Alphaproteobacteria bacterium]
MTLDHHHLLDLQLLKQKIADLKTMGTEPGRAGGYFLKTERLGFSRWQPNDLPLAQSLWGDAQVTRLIGGPFSPRQVEERLAREIGWMSSFSVQYWPLFLLRDGEFVGCCGLRPYKPEERIYETGFQLRPAFWGQGLATEAERAVIVHAFGTLGAKGLFAGHHPQNAASQHVLEKLGFRFTHEELYPPTGLMHRAYFLVPVQRK